MAHKNSRRPEDQSGAAAVIFEQGYAEDSRFTTSLQPPFAVSRIATRFGLPFPTAATLAELAGYPAGACT